MAGHEVQSCASGAEALQYAKERDPDCVVTDLQMPGMDGIELIENLKKIGSQARLIVVTAHASVSTAVRAMRFGAFDYIEKPFDIENLERLVEEALRHHRLLVPYPSQKSDRTRDRKQDDSFTLPPMVGSSERMCRLRQRIEMVAGTSETVLIMGENGTGKEVVARHIHANSPRKDKSWITLNCPALSAQLMESELFGHQRGAFTGAEQDRIGRFEMANRGTLLLDEISEIDLALQSKLLRVLQERAFERVGSSETIHVDARILATTNRNLSREVNEGRFREDLFYRLAVVPIEVPPLRERREDIPELVEHFQLHIGERLNRKPPDFDESAMSLLCEYDWPGNVRELENIVTRVSVFEKCTCVTASDLRRWLMKSSEDGGRECGSRVTGNEKDKHSREIVESLGWEKEQEEELPVGISLEEMERKLIEATLRHHQGHRMRTAQTLGIGVRTLSGKLKQYGYAPREKPAA